MDVHKYLYHIFLQNIVIYFLMLIFLFSSLRKNAHTLQIINTEFDTTASSPLDSSFKQFSKHDSYEYLFSPPILYNVNTRRSTPGTWKQRQVLYVYWVNTGCPRGHILVTHWSKNAFWRNLPGDSKRAAWAARSYHVRSRL